MTAKLDNAVALDTLAGGVPDLSKPATAARFAEVISAGKLDQMTPQQQSIFLLGLGAYIGIKPELGDLMIYDGKPYITISGFRRIAHNTGLLNGIQTEPASDRDRLRFRATAKEHLWLCRVYRKGHARPYTGWGYIRESELEQKQGRNGKFDPVTRKYPQDMAEKRATYDALRLAFPPNEAIGNVHMKYIAEAEEEAARTHVSNQLASGEYDDRAIDEEIEARDAIVEASPEPEFQDDRDIA
jgi:RecT family